MTKHLRALKKSQKGFSLIEITMSIGILAIVSIFVMQMYIKAASLKDMAFDKDYALTTAQTALEIYKAHGPEPENWIPSLFLFNEAFVSWTDDPQSYVVECYYDKYWRPVSSQLIEGYTLRLIMKNDYNLTASGQLTQADVSVIRHHPYLLSNEDHVTLCSLQSSTYFPFLPSERI